MARGLIINHALLASLQGYQSTTALILETISGNQNCQCCHTVFWFACTALSRSSTICEWENAITVKLLPYRLNAGPTAAIIQADMVSTSDKTRVITFQSDCACGTLLRIKD